MSNHYHAVAWIDHHEARIIHFNADERERRRIAPSDPPHHLHIKAGSPAGTHVTDEPAFYADVVAALRDTPAVLLAGPATAKDEFIRYTQRHAPEMISHIVKHEKMDHPTDNQLLAAARRFFASADRLTPQRG
jgi:hypothetical protein